MDRDDTKPMVVRRGPRGGSRNRGLAFWVAALSFVLTQQSLDAVTLAELRGDAKMSTKRFASYFSSFDYEFHEEVQEWEVFLKTRKGDCDDYATLADDVLSGKGLQTRLITVRMPGLVHVVCYVVPDKAYLDYNLRTYLKKTAPAADSLPAIADRVADSFKVNWTSASEFVFQDGLKRMVKTIAHIAPPK